ncbi:hypothetical protein HanXRQr2_Chr02g0082571 [Helianthus annuus]|uniref:Uncharacterized protein n=1 Tax=Helianthus annuus TaxID=4232 RepID=A0A9K3P083_HELAN|nr:hypothetical protein HanXRQr2_Chr02g0082571 [Helianthus annuus]
MVSELIAHESDLWDFRCALSSFFVCTGTDLVVHSSESRLDSFLFLLDLMIWKGF